MTTAACSYNDMWPKEFFWVRPHPTNKHAALCTLCNSQISLSNMGRGALTSHRKGISHKRKEQRACMSTSITDFSVAKKSNENNDISSVLASTTPEIQKEIPSISSVLASTTPEIQKEIPSTSTVPSGIKKFLLKENITRAEILWCLEIVSTHRSLRSAEKDTKLFPQIFTDSEIAKGMQIGRDKMMYCIVFGLAPYFKEELLKDILLCDHFVIGFDESLNKITQRQQMDLNIRYWCIIKNEVQTRYLNSAFLGRSCAPDLLKAFRETSEPLNLKKMLQVSMDGPKVNFKFFQELQTAVKEVPEDPEILNIGSCGLHTVNLAFKTGAKSVDWKIFDFMRSLYYIFKDSPARRALYTYYTKSHVFPKKFCSIRWLENADVAERCLNIIPDIKIFIEKIEKDKNAPSSHSYMQVKNLLKDSLLPAKLAFFQSVAREFEIFLKEYQTDAPLIPFLYDDLSGLMLRIIRRFVKKEAITKGNPIKVDIDETSNYLPCSEIELGISTLCSLRKNKVSEGQLRTFQRDCQKFLVSCVKKLHERSPLIYEVTRAVSCLNPRVVLNQTLFEKRLTRLLLILCEKNWFVASQADRAKSQFLEICFEASNITKLKSFNKTDRIDHFWYEMLSSASIPCPEATLLVKMMLVLSHGNSNVERGFSVNKECLWENMKEETVIARRLVYDAIQAHGGLNGFQISKQMMLCVKNSRSRFEEHKEKKRQEEREMLSSLKRKKETETQLKELEVKKSKILDIAQKETLKIEEEIASIKLLQKKL